MTELNKRRAKILRLFLLTNQNNNKKYDILTVIIASTIEFRLIIKFGEKEPNLHEDKEILERIAGILNEDIDSEFIVDAVSGILKAIGKDPEREGLL